MEGSASYADAYPMQGGDGSSSYAKNSAYQKTVVNGTKPMILDAIAEHLAVGSNLSKVVIADLGCSTGPNTFFSVENIIEALELKYGHGLEFQVFFNDHAANDFNILFKTLPVTAKYYAAGVPGSFHGRLFPKSTIHVAHSSYSLQWLSRVPPEIRDSSCRAWNKGKIFWPGKEKEVIESYLSQYEKDMGAFLDARAKEVVCGGLVMMSFIVRPNGVLDSGGIMFELLGACLEDMANEGIFAEEKVDSFNLPIYFPTIGEVEEILNKNVSFSMEKLEMIEKDPVNMEALTSNVVAGMILAALGATMEEHFGCDIVENVRPRFINKIEQNQHLLNQIADRHIDLFILLKRKPRSLTTCSTLLISS
uniref:Uncharacterized protein n=1 Tax=Kalanchoe fedtschenkoi TaxID=63787 RepID=A0A7N0VDD8_KALFE